MSNIYRSLEFNEILGQIEKLCSFSLGKEQVAKIEPSNNSLLVNRSLSLTKEVMEMFNLAQEYDLGGARDVRNLLDRSEKDIVITGLDLLYVSQINNVVKSVVSSIKNTEVKNPNLKDLTMTLSILDDLSKLINQSISPYGEVMDSASSKLRALRKEAITLNATFESSINNFINRNKTILADTISNERNGRVVVLLNSTYKNTVKGVVHGESKSGQSVYFEPEAFISLNNNRQSVQHMIDDEIERILFTLSQAVKVESPQIRVNLETLAQLDAILAIAKWGFEREAIVATLSKDHAIYLKNSAHPLIDKDDVVKNTYKINDGSMLIVSGPNTGGKTVTLKTIGLSILMTLCGIPVIADEAILPIVDNIFIDLGDQQSVVASLSTFSSHLTQLSNIVNNVTENSLVLLDELGGGTDPKEGEALAIAVLEHLKTKRAITLVTTHLSGLKNYAQNDETTILASVEFDASSLTPTYRFIEGLAGQSNALEIAAKFNFPKSIMDRANALKDTMMTDEEKLMANLQIQERQLLIKQEKLDKANLEMTLKNAELERKIAADQAQKSQIIQEAKKEAQIYIDKTKIEIDKLYEEILEVNRFSKLHEAIDIKQKVSNLQSGTSLTEKIKHDFKVNDKVRVDDFHHIGEIIDLNNKNVTVIVNGMNIKTKLNKLTYVEESEIVKPKKTYKIKTTSVGSMELNLIGKAVFEALPEVDKFIDNAILSNLTSVRIVHGVGTGKLRNEVHKHLKKVKSVANFEYAPQSQGGSGATIVTFKR